MDNTPKKSLKSRHNTFCRTNLISLLLLRGLTSVFPLKGIYKALITIIILSISSSLLYAQSSGDEEQKNTKLDIMILMDSSGSMLVTDPQRLRDRGVELFAERLASDDRVGLVKFAEDAKLVLPLNPRSASLPKILQAELSRIETTGTYTNLYAGIEVAAKQLLSSVRDDATPILVLLSDGKMEPSPQFGDSQAISKKLLDDLLPDLRAKNIRIYTLSFSDQADRDLLAKIAKSTDAASWFTPSVEKLQRSFEDLLLVLKKATPSIPKSKSLLVEKDVEDATFYMGRNASQVLTLISPTGQAYKFDAKPDEVLWHRGTDFDVVTIPSPEVGTWNIEGYGDEEGFATVLPELGITIELPPTIRADSPIALSVSLVDRAKPVALTKMLELVSFEFEITPTNRVSEPVVKGFLTVKGGDKAVVQESIKLDQVGEYNILVKAVGSTFRREQGVIFAVKPPLITLKGVSKSHSPTSHEVHEGHGSEPSDSHELESSGDSTGTKSEHDTSHGDSYESSSSDPLREGEDEHAEELIGFDIALHPDALKYKDLSVKVVVIDSRSHRREFNAERVPGDPKRYRLNLDQLEEDGDYTGVAILRAQNAKGEEVITESLPVEFKFVKQLSPHAMGKDSHGEPHEEAAHGGHEVGIAHEDEHSTHAEPNLINIILGTTLANIIGLLLLLKLIRFKNPRGIENLDESAESIQTHMSDSDEPSQQSELDELKAFVQRVELKVISRDIDPLDTAYDDIVMRVEDRLAAEDLAELSNHSEGDQETQEA